MGYVEIIDLEMIMKQYGMSRYTATKLLNNPRCHTLPREKGETYRIARSNWERFLLEESNRIR